MESHLEKYVQRINQPNFFEMEINAVKYFHLFR